MNQTMPVQEQLWRLWTSNGCNMPYAEGFEPAFLAQLAAPDWQPDQAKADELLALLARNAHMPSFRPEDPPAEFETTSLGPEVPGYSEPTERAVIALFQGRALSPFTHWDDPRLSGMRSTQCFSLWHWAVGHGFEALALWMLRHPECPPVVALSAPIPYGDGSALAHAVRCNASKLTQALLVGGADVEERVADRNHTAKVPVWFTARSVPMVRTCLQAGANPAAVDSVGRGAMAYWNTLSDGTPKEAMSQAVLGALSPEFQQAQHNLALRHALLKGMATDTKAALKQGAWLDDAGTLAVVGMIKVGIHQRLRAEPRWGALQAILADPRHPLSAEEDAQVAALIVREARFMDGHRSSQGTKFSATTLTHAKAFPDAEAKALLADPARTGALLGRWSRALAEHTDSADNGARTLVRVAEHASWGHWGLGLCDALAVVVPHYSGNSDWARTASQKCLQVAPEVGAASIHTEAGWLLAGRVLAQASWDDSQHPLKARWLQWMERWLRPLDEGLTPTSTTQEQVVQAFERSFPEVAAALQARWLAQAMADTPAAPRARLRL